MSPLLRATLLFFAFVLAGGCHHDDATAGALPPLTIVHRGDRIEIPPESPLRGRLRVEPVAARSVRRALTAPAEVEADPARMARITPPLPGRILQLFVRFGDRVNANQPLLSLNSPDLVAAQTDYLRARSALAQADRTLSRQRDLATHGIGAQREVEQAATDRDLAHSELERTELRLRLLRSDPGALGQPLTVRSPISGRIVEFHVAQGEYRNDPSDSMMTIADLSTVWVTANVQEKDIQRVQAGEDVSASFAAYPAERWTGHITSVGDLLEAATRTIKVRTAFDNTERRLRPGMFASVTFTERAAPELVVPSTAIVLVGDANYVFVEVGAGAFVRRRIVPGAQVDDVTAVIDGLHVGERIVVANAVLLQ